MNEEKPVCPNCREKTHVKKNGKFRGKQRYFCSECNRSFQLDHSDPVSKNESAIILDWMKGQKPLEVAAEDNSISRYYLKKMIIKKYNLMLQEVEQQIKRLKEDLKKREIMIKEYSQDLPSSSHGKGQLDHWLEDSKHKLNASTQALIDAERRLRELEDLKGLMEPKLIEDLKENAPVLGDKLGKNPKGTFNFSEFKKFLREI